MFDNGLISTIISHLCHIVCVWVGLFLRWVALRFFFFFFFTRFHFCGYCSMNSNCNCWLSAVNRAYMHCSRTHKLHFLSTFSLKMGPTVLFTHLKIILLQCFQFSVLSFSKISSIQTDPSSDFFFIQNWKREREREAFDFEFFPHDSKSPKTKKNDTVFVSFQYQKKKKKKSHRSTAQ